MMITATQDWQGTNQQYLTAALENVRVALQDYRARSQGARVDGSRPSAIVDLETMAADRSPPALLQLCLAFGLTEFERDLLMLCAGVELSASLAQLCGTLNGSPQQAYPTFSLALAALPDAHWDAITPVRPLRRWQLLTVSNGESLTQSRLRVDERVLHYLHGISYVDDRLRGLVQPLTSDAELPRSHQQLADRIAPLWFHSSDRSPVIQLCGHDLDGKYAIAAAACDQLGLQLHRLRAVDIPTAVAERDALACLWEREAFFSHSALLVDCDEFDVTAQRATLPLLEALQGMVFVAGHEPIAFASDPVFAWMSTSPCLPNSVTFGKPLWVFSRRN